MALFHQGQALLIGIADYKHILALPDVVIHDVHGIYQLLIDSLRCGYPIPNVQTLLDAQATKSAMLAAFESLAARCTPDSTAFIYFSGHGGSVGSGADAGQYLLPVDVEVASGELVASSAISHDEFTACLDKIPARRVVVFFDCCHAGGIGTLKKGVSFNLKSLPDDYYENLSEGQGRAIFASSRADETSLILEGANNSLFTEVLLQGLKGEAANRTKGVVRVVDLYSYVSNAIGDLNVSQHPFFRCSAENFPLALYQGEALPSASPAHATREAEATLKVQTSAGLSDRLAVEVAHIKGRPSIESRVEAERKQIARPRLGTHRQVTVFMSDLYASDERVQEYLGGSFSQYLKKRDAYLDAYNRLIRIDPVLLNDGSKPATEVQLVIDFLALGETLLKSEMPSRPDKPRRPSADRMAGLFDGGYDSRLAALQAIPRGIRQKRETEPFEFDGTKVEWHIRHLQHKRSVELEPLFLLVHLPLQPPATVEVPFEIHATEFANPKQGKLLFDVAVRSLYWEEAEEEDLQKQRAEDRKRR